MSDTTPLLDVSGLTKHFPIKGGFPIRRTVGAVQAVDGLDFQVAEGESLGLVGESGCGKSTTGRLITRLLEPTAGRISYRGQDITHANRKQLAPIRSEIQMIFQDPYASLNPRHTVGKIISGPMEINGINPPGGHEKRVRELLEIVGLNPEHYNRFPHEFSGGQRQRIGVARCTWARSSRSATARTCTTTRATLTRGLCSPPCPRRRWTRSRVSASV